MALFSSHLSRRKFLTRSTLLSGLAGGVAGRLPAFVEVGKGSANPLALDDGSSGAVGADTGTDTRMKVWAINDSVRVDPIRNHPLKIIQAFFETGFRPGYKQSNLIWDGSSHRITLKVARNETVAFQIVIERTGEKLTNVKLTPAALAGPNGAGISLDNLELFREWYVPVRTPSRESYTLGPGWYPDGLLP